MISPNAEHTKYTESDNFEILLFGVSVDNGPVVVYDLASSDEIPARILQHYLMKM